MKIKYAGFTGATNFEQEKEKDDTSAGFQKLKWGQYRP